MVKETGAVKYIETSAKLNRGVKEVTTIIIIYPGRKIINPSGGYPPDIHRMRSDLWPMSVECRFQSMR